MDAYGRKFGKIVTLQISLKLKKTLTFGEQPSQRFRAHPERGIPIFPKESVRETPGAFLGFETTCLGFPDPFLNDSQSFPKRPAGISQDVTMPAISLQHYQKRHPDRDAPGFPRTFGQSIPGRPHVVYLPSTLPSDVPSFPRAFGWSIPGFPRASCD